MACQHVRSFLVPIVTIPDIHFTILLILRPWEWSARASNSNNNNYNVCGAVTTESLRELVHLVHLTPLEHVTCIGSRSVCACVQRPVVLQRRAMTTVSMATSISDDTGNRDGVLQITPHATATDLLPADRALLSTPITPTMKMYQMELCGWSRRKWRHSTQSHRCPSWRMWSYRANGTVRDTTHQPAGWRLTNGLSTSPAARAADHRPTAVPYSFLPFCRPFRALSPWCRWLLWYLCQQWDRMALAWGEETLMMAWHLGGDAGNSLMQQWKPSCCHNAAC